MLHPKQFQVNEAWIAFKVNDSPMHTQQGDFNFIALMDAASCFLLSFATVSAALSEPTEMESRRLLEQAQAYKKQWPKTLFVPVGQPAHFLSAEAERRGIEVVRIAEDQLLPIIAAARTAFIEYFGKSVH